MIPGLTHIPNFITPEEEAELIQEVDKAKWLTDLSRRVQHYGYKYNYRERSITKKDSIGPLPEWVQWLHMRIRSASLFMDVPDQLIINEYYPGQGISHHIDCVPCFKEDIASISLGSAVEMEFRKGYKGELRTLMLEPRSCLALSREARYKWSHAIQPRIQDGERMRGRRISLTFRNVILT